MTENEINALVSLLDDDDKEVLSIVHAKLLTVPNAAIPLMAKRLEEPNLEENLQQKIEELIHTLRYNTVFERLSAWKNSGAVDLLEGLWLVALYQYPDLKLEDLRSQIKQFKLEAWLDFRENQHPYDQIKILNHTFFNRLNFVANTKQFHAIENSMVNQILELRASNPIGLCCIYMIIAQELGLPIYGVNLPNVFVLTYKQPNLQFYINVFGKGVILSRHELELHVKQLKIESQDAFFEPCSNLTIIRRLLRNLIISFEKANNKDSAEQTERILKAMIG